jgi:hypothetical protein
MDGVSSPLSTIMVIALHSEGEDEQEAMRNGMDSFCLELTIKRFLPLNDTAATLK